MNNSKRQLVAVLFTLLNIVVFAQTDTPAITMSLDVDGKERSFTFANYGHSGFLHIDWGDGVLVKTDTIPHYNGWAQKVVYGVPKGEGTVKIYGADQIALFEAFSVYSDGHAHIHTIDLSQAVNLIKLTLSGNRIEHLDLTNNPKLQILNSNNNILSEIDLSHNPELHSVGLSANCLTSIDLSANKELTRINLSDNNIAEADFSANTTLKNVTFLNNHLKDVKFGDNTVLNTLRLNNNDLTTIDLSKQTGLIGHGILFITNNLLTEIKLPEGRLKTINITHNKLTKEALPVNAAAKYMFEPQDVD